MVCVSFPLSEGRNRATHACASSASRPLQPARPPLQEEKGSGVGGTRAAVWPKRVLAEAHPKGKGRVAPSGYNGHMSPPTLDFWFEFASTYSYPAAMRAASLAERAGVALRWRPFLLGPIFKAQGWNDSPFNLYPAKGRYMWRDVARICAAQGLPFKRPAIFPQNTLLAARVALVALDQGWGEDYCRAIYTAEFVDGCNIGLAEAVAAVIAAQGKDAESVLAEAGSERIKLALREQVAEAQRLGIFGAPSFVTADGELFWGNDRLETALQWTGGHT
jgi:2-hydroxychromene-2-carboxylate isomerase